MLRCGVIILNLWAGLNLVFAIACLFAIAFFDQNSPGLTMMVEDSDVRQLGPRWLTLINGLAALCNTFDAACFLLALFVIQTSLVKKARWAFWCLLVSGCFLQAFVCVSYSFFGAGIIRMEAVTANLIGIIISSTLLLAGLGLTGLAIYREV